MMQTASITGIPKRPATGSIAAIITICTQQKRLKASAAGTPAGLKTQSQAGLEADWQLAVAALPNLVRASDLYAGRAFGLAKTAAGNAASPLYVISAGLGLVPGDLLAPAYGLTLTKNVAESIVSKVDGPFDSPSWFASVIAGGRSVGWDRVERVGPGRILVAMTRPYAEMVAPSLAATPPPMLARLRIFGAGLKQALPPILHPAIAPYDDRLDALVPGTRSDFAQRALLHFVDYVAHQPLNRKAEFEAISSILAHVIAPERPIRDQRSDAELLLLIKGRVGPRSSASRLLRQLRDEDGIACEQSRFARLFRSVATSENAA